MQEVNGEVLLEDVHIKFEMRKSDLIDVGSKGAAHLEATTVSVLIDEQSILDLIYSNNLTP